MKTMTFACLASRCHPSALFTLSGSSTVPLGAARSGYHLLRSAPPQTKDLDFLVTPFTPGDSLDSSPNPKFSVPH